MSCETNQNKATDAASSSGGIPRAANKFAHSTIRVAKGLIGGGSGAIKSIVNAVVELQAGNAAQLRAASQQKAELAQDKRAQKAALELQQNYLGAVIQTSDLKQLLGETTENTHLSGESWLAETELGTFIYDQSANNGHCTLYAIQPNLGKEIELRNNLAAYTTQAAEQEENDRSGKRLTKLAQWVGDHGDELGVITHHVLTAAFTGASIKTGLALIGGVKKVSLAKHLTYAGAITGVVASVYINLQHVRAEKARIAKIVAEIKAPERQKAVVALQKNYQGLRIPEQELAEFMSAKPFLFYEKMGQMAGPLGAIYYEALADGQVSIQRIIPAIGREISLQKGLDSLKGRG